jgi:hypothetical protein
VILAALFATGCYVLLDGCGGVMADERCAQPYPSDVSEEEWSLVAPYPAPVREDAPRRQYPLRKLFNGLRYVIRYGISARAAIQGMSGMACAGVL